MVTEKGKSHKWTHRMEEKPLSISTDTIKFSTIAIIFSQCGADSAIVHVLGENCVSMATEIGKDNNAKKIKNRGAKSQMSSASGHSVANLWRYRSSYRIFFFCDNNVVFDILEEKCASLLTDERKIGQMKKKKKWYLSRLNGHVDGWLRFLSRSRRATFQTPTMLGEISFRLAR